MVRKSSGVRRYGVLEKLVLYDVRVKQVVVKDLRKRVYHGKSLLSGYDVSMLPDNYVLAGVDEGGCDYWVRKSLVWGLA